MKKTLIRKLFFILYGALISLTSVSQENSLKVYFPEMKVTSPESSKLSQFLSYPVSKALGLVNISIPLFEMPTPNGPMPFTISYHASGIRVEDPIGMLGYGWSLFPSARIVRENNGKPDDICKRQMPSNIKPEYLSDSVAYYATPTEYDFPAWGYDLEHDIFSVSINNESTSFIIERISEHQLKAIKIKDSPLKIDPVCYSSGTLMGFKIQDDQGTVYNYGEPEGYVLMTSSEVASNASDYLLSSIVYPNGQVVSFNQELIAVKTRLPSLSYDILIQECTTYHLNPVFNSYSLKVPGPQWDYCISDITFPTGKVIFKYDHSIISNIKILNNESSVIKTITFEMMSDLLKSVDISDKGKYLFEYNPTTFERPYSQDKFGYYNGKWNTNASSLLPNTIIEEHTHYPGDDRLTDSIRIQAYMLNKITYPTGGTAAFEYELNKGYKSSDLIKAGLRIKKISQYDPVSQKNMVTTYKYGKNESGYGIAVSDFNDCYHYFAQDVKWYDVGGLAYEAQRGVISPYNSDISQCNNQFKIWYDEVTEYTEKGKVIEEYIYEPVRGHLFNTDVWQYIYESPMLVRQRIYNGNNIIQETEWEYEQYDGHAILGYHISANTLFFMDDGFTKTIYFMDTHPNEFCFYNRDRINPTSGRLPYEYDYLVVPYNIYTGLYQPSMKHVTQFESQSAPLETTEYYYWQEDPFNIDEKISTDSKNQNIIEKTYYANTRYPNYPDSIINLLKSSNYLTVPIAKEYYAASAGTEPLRIEKIIYSRISQNLIKPTSLYIKNQGMEAFEKQVDYTYYPDGNLATIKDKNELQTVFLWGYNHSLLIAEIKDVTLEEVVAIVGDIQQLATTAPNTSLLDSLRSRLPHSAITTYTHSPLVGITSITDSRGDKILYSYNNKNQLVEIYRLVNGIKQSIETYEYKYATENP